MLQSQALPATCKCCPCSCRRHSAAHSCGPGDWRRGAAQAVRLGQGRAAVQCHRLCRAAAHSVNVGDHHSYTFGHGKTERLHSIRLGSITMHMHLLERRSHKTNRSCRYDWGYTPEVLGGVSALQWSPDNRALAVGTNCCCDIQYSVVSPTQVCCHLDHLAKRAEEARVHVWRPGGLGVAGHRSLVTIGVPADVLAAAGGKGSWHDTPHSSVAAVALHRRKWGVIAAAGGGASDDAADLLQIVLHTYLA